MTFFEIKPSFLREKDRAAYAQLTYDAPGPATQWLIALNQATEPCQALGAPQSFFGAWWTKHHPKHKEHPDWVSNTYCRPVCSQRAWSVFSRHAAPAMTWIPIPMPAGQPVSLHGVLWGYPLVDIYSVSDSTPDFFKAQTDEESLSRFFVSARLKSAIEQAGLIGAEFFELNAELLKTFDPGFSNFD